MSESGAEVPRLALVARSVLFAETLTRSLSTEGIEIAVTVEPTPASLDLLRGAEAALTLVEANGTVADTAALLRRIHSVAPVPIVVVGTPLTDPELLDLIEVGCCGCVPRDASMRELVEAIRNVCCGLAECSPYLAALVSARIRELSRDLTGDDALPALTRREAEVLRLAAQGLSNKEIAHRLDVWLQTIKTHLHNVYEKLDVRTRRAAVAKALRLGMIRDP